MTATLYLDHPWSIHDRSVQPTRFALKLYIDNPDPIDPPMSLLAELDIEATDEHTAREAALHYLDKSKSSPAKDATSWELIERIGLHWDAFDAQCGCWEFTEQTVFDSWQQLTIEQCRERGKRVEYCCVLADSSRAWITAQVTGWTKTRLHVETRGGHTFSLTAAAVKANLRPA